MPVSNRSINTSSKKSIECWRTRCSIPAVILWSRQQSLCIKSDAADGSASSPPVLNLMITLYKHDDERGEIIIHLMRNQNKCKQQWANQCKIIACLLRESSQSFSDAIAIKLFRRLVSCCWQWWAMLKLCTNVHKLATGWWSGGEQMVTVYLAGDLVRPKKQMAADVIFQLQHKLDGYLDEAQGKIGVGIWVWSTLCSHPVTSWTDRKKM